MEYDFPEPWVCQNTPQSSQRHVGTNGRIVGDQPLDHAIDAEGLLVASDNLDDLSLAAIKEHKVLDQVEQRVLPQHAAQQDW
jgi:hypothetical protein